MHWETSEIEGLDKRFRTNLINSLSGLKSLNLCGTVNEMDQTNLAIINSVVHVGANPALLGMVMRPSTVPRHTLSNILSTRHYTLNHVHLGIFRNAHQTSAKYQEDVSEFEECGLHPQYSAFLPAPYVEEARVKIGLELRENLEISSNGTYFIVGQILEVQLPDAAVAPDGFVDLSFVETMAGGGLDAYYEVSKAHRMPYAKPFPKD